MHAGFGGIGGLLLYKRSMAFADMIAAEQERADDEDEFF